MWATWGSALGWQVEGIYETGHYALHSRTSALASREQHLLVAWQDKVLTLLAFLVQKVRTLLAFPGAKARILTFEERGKRGKARHSVYYLLY